MYKYVYSHAQLFKYQSSVQTWPKRYRTLQNAYIIRYRYYSLHMVVYDNKFRKFNSLTCILRLYTVMRNPTQVYMVTTSACTIPTASLRKNNHGHIKLYIKLNTIFHGPYITLYKSYMTT